MDEGMEQFERIVRRASEFTQQSYSREVDEHPFDLRGIHQSLPIDVRSLFDNGHYSQATFEAFKFLDNEVKRHAKSNKMGTDLMMQAFSEQNPLLKLNPLNTETEKSEQSGYKFLFAGAMAAIRNPRGHEHGVVDSVDECLDHLSYASMLLRRLKVSPYFIAQQ